MPFNRKQKSVKFKKEMYFYNTTMMQFLYNLATYITKPLLWCTQFFSKKMRLFVKGRNETFSILKNNISDEDKTIWFHCASLGEYEQGVPIMVNVKKKYPDYKIIISFFSPSGYEVKKNNSVGDVVVYLPLDTVSNSKQFFKLVHPTIAVFVKYEIWPNYLKELKSRNIHTLLISGLFRESQVFFKPYGTFMRKALKKFDHFFVQNHISEELLRSIGIQSSTISGDTRFDRVSQQIEQDNSLSFISDFKGNSLCIVCGSTWPEDEAVLLDYINSTSEMNIKFIIAPHKIVPSKIEAFRKKLKSSSILYSEMKGEKLSEKNIFIIDTIGLLTKIYSYADIAYVGGAMGSTGLHNILEPATFGVPIVIGHEHNEFPEAERLRSLAGLFTVKNSTECSEILEKLSNDADFRNKTGMIAGHFVNSNTGATRIIMDYIAKLL